MEECVSIVEYILNVRFFFSQYSVTCEVGRVLNVAKDHEGLKVLKTETENVGEDAKIFVPLQLEFTTCGKIASKIISSSSSRHDETKI